jgi:hypothetical protein
MIGKNQENSQVIIAYHWRKKLARIRASRKRSVIKPVEEKKVIKSKVKPYIDDKLYLSGSKNSRATIVQPKQPIGKKVA